MADPLISIVLPTYNGARYIKVSIESCLNQTVSDFELILVNDCSTDETPTLIEQYAQLDPRIRIIHNAFNKKLPQSLNAGFEVANGTYFTWTSDDNYYAPDALEKMLAVLQKNPAIDLVYCDYTLIDDNGDIKGTRIFGDVNKSFNRWLGCGACFLYKRTIHFANNGYNPAAFLIEDYDFFVRAYLKFHFYYLSDTTLYFYREHGASLTATQSTTINEVSKIFLERNLPGLEKKLPSKEVALVYRKLAVYYAVQKNIFQKYELYISKLQTLSFFQAIVTALYVLLKKMVFAFTIGFAGFLYLLKAPLKK